MIFDDILDTMTYDEVYSYLDNEKVDMWLSSIEYKDIDFV